MTLNISRFNADIEKLIEESKRLEFSLLVKVDGKDEFLKAINESGKDSDKKRQKNF